MINKKSIDKLLAIITVIIIASAWFIGKKLEKADIELSLHSCIASAERFDEIGQSTYKALNENNEIVGFITLAESDGYGGPVVLAVGVNTEGNIIGLSIVNSKETPSYLNKVISMNYLEDFNGKTYKDKYKAGDDIDIVSGATFSSKAILNAAHIGQNYLAKNYLDLNAPPIVDQSIEFGLPEITLLILFGTGFFAHKNTFKYKKAVRWGTMLIGLFILGFYYNQPLTLSIINQFFMGYFPSWQTHIYWYLLLGGIFFVFTVDNKNPYCQWFCPFGAAQECIGAIGGAKVSSPKRFKTFLMWTQRILALAAIVAALLIRNPGVTSFEIFGTLFKFTGSNFQFTVLGIILILSLFIKRPWCNYLCPLKPVVELLTNIRKWIINLWKNKTIKTVE